MTESGRVCYDRPINEPSSGDRHHAGLAVDDVRVGENYRECEAGDDEDSGEEAAKVDGWRAFVGRAKLVAPAVREYSVRKGSEYKGQSNEKREPVLP